MSDMTPNDDMTPNRSNRAGWIAFSLALAIAMATGIGAIAILGVPGEPGGSSPSQQQASGAPAPETTGSR
jgi:hypothetical protein